MTDLHSQTVLVTGASGATGRALIGALVPTGARIIAIGRDESRLRQIFSDIPCYGADLTDHDQVNKLARLLDKRHGPVHTLVHLVGGWRGGADLVANTDADWQVLAASIVDSLRHLTLALLPTLNRAVIVSTTALDHPTAGNANYVAAKAAAEAWMAALADHFETRDGAATVLRVKAIVTDAMRQAQPEATFATFTDAGLLAHLIRDVLAAPAAQVNGAVLDLTTNQAE